MRVAVPAGLRSQDRARDPGGLGHRGVAGGRRLSGGEGPVGSAQPQRVGEGLAALAELRRGKAPDAVIDTALNSMAETSDSPVVARAIASFLDRAA